VGLLIWHGGADNFFDLTFLTRQIGSYFDSFPNHFSPHNFKRDIPTLGLPLRINAESLQSFLNNVTSSKPKSRTSTT